ncbi:MULTISPECIES: hypothetical protein [Streptomyces]|uniref:hypothetical protein n=1 Tax=Streptomyces TaxID=1883 RepID=UPI0014896C50|nr:MULTISPECIES: hypothetical protein [Streptomyces]
MRSLRPLLPPALAAAVAATAAALLLTGAPLATADDLPPVAVEDFAYPDADKIYAEHGIRLLTGDGNILFADCGSATNLIQVYARGHSDPFCFSAKGQSGRVAMELPQVYGIRTNEYKIVADMTVDGTETSYTVAANSWGAVGESVDGRDHTLVELHATK